MANDCAYLVAGKRSPVGRFLGTISALSAMELGGQRGKGAAG